MQLSEITGAQSLAAINPLSHISTTQNNAPTIHFSTFFNAYPTPHFQNPQKYTCLSNNSTSDESEENQLSLIDERKQRRIISNRESARRSRMRKQKHLNELGLQIMRLRSENRGIMEKLNYVSECHERVVKENSQLRKEVSDLRQELNYVKLDQPFDLLREIEEVPCNTAHLRAESTNKPITTSMGLLH